MPEGHSVVTEYADELVQTPRAHLRLELKQDEDGLSLEHTGQLLARCHLSREGMVAGGFLAKALGVPIPPIGESVTARVSTGVLYRALGICQLDFEEESSFVLLERLLDEAEMQRGARSDAE
ncbi:MAG: hypothetical protein FI707_10045 [SAR202 cluster bacterium]|jgi:hypothetical protein|nr:hypothetical protein [Chloroflexota bacterium]MDP6422880.1 hypothetical protein [SAR202 cluster bacterium]HAL46962.1 hypothetical protein [Dehalococcoidia bacterium]MDP6665458.1 hypothetical protein [SAR202 cluster bacterium]MDP6798252.1 hypothetical protein [SAR202 cluster bacterium]|tara:strand:- start:7089 stop:7454 length:366 start_codon:yes stop_codon:yes gene_type:complete